MLVVLGVFNEIFCPTPVGLDGEATLAQCGVKIESNHSFSRPFLGNGGCFQETLRVHQRVARFALYITQQHTFPCIHEYGRIHTCPCHHIQETAVDTSHHILGRQEFLLGWLLSVAVSGRWCANLSLKELVSQHFELFVMHKLMGRRYGLVLGVVNRPICGCICLSLQKDFGDFGASRRSLGDFRYNSHKVIIVPSTKLSLRGPLAF
mmetsp:Transcript_6184/g.13904  ORF Transcript_6184/g.13904 Transcript_6184/m.13904 type:complete len:207 (-) Transcript_6184:336-956(-)